MSEHEDETVVVTYGADDKARTLHAQVLGRRARLVYLRDLAPEERRKALTSATALISWSPGKELEDEETALLSGAGLLQLLSAGADHVPFAKLPEGLAVAGNVGAFAEPMAEHVLAMALALKKRLLANHAKLAAGEFVPFATTGVLRGSVCGILGFGGIGRAVARLMRTIGLSIYAVNTSGQSSEPTDFIGTLDDLEHVLGAADCVVISLPLNRWTRGLIGRRELGWMKPDAMLINVARGAIVDEHALYEHMRANPDFAAGIDAWWVEPFREGAFRTAEPFFDLPNFLGSPHNSAVVPGVMVEATRMAAENVLRALRDEPVQGLMRREDYLEEH